MSDITKCLGRNCSIRNTCYRFTSTSNMYKQSYADFDLKFIDLKFIHQQTIDHNIQCEHFWENYDR
jgi:hypothetical protein